MTRAILIIALTAIASPAFAGEKATKVETITVNYRSEYVEGVRKNIRARQGARRSELAKLGNAKDAKVSILPRESELFRRSLMLPVSSEASGVASR